jgi:hypothetical protein
MLSMTRLVASAAAVFALVALSTARAEDAKQIDGGKGSKFQSKSYDMKDGDQVSVTLTFEPEKEVYVTVEGEGDSDTHLLMKSKYFEWKDTSPSPVCRLKFIPVKGDDKFTFTIKNMRAANKITLAVKVAK